jgi:hypothetical protein
MARTASSNHGLVTGRRGMPRARAESFGPCSPFLVMANFQHGLFWWLVRFPIIANLFRNFKHATLPFQRLGLFFMAARGTRQGTSFASASASAARRQKIIMFLGRGGGVLRPKQQSFGLRWWCTDVFFASAPGASQQTRLYCWSIKKPCIATKFRSGSAVRRPLGPFLPVSSRSPIAHERPSPDARAAFGF